jgi:hypothetical protein
LKERLEDFMIDASLWFERNVEDTLRNIKYGLQNLWAYKTIIWKDRDWDKHFLLKLMEFKFRRMSEHHTKYGHFQRSDETAKELMIAANLCRRLSEDNYMENWNTGHNIIFPDIEFEGNRLKPMSEADGKKLRWSFEMSEKVHQHDLDLLAKMISRKLRTWWD